MYKLINHISSSILLADQALNYTNFTNNTNIYENELFFEYKWWQKVFFALFIIPVIIFSISGNIFVIVAIVKCKQLQITGNIFLASLAVADSAIGFLVMPLNALQLLTGHWYLGAIGCRLWFSCDILFSTASILHLFIISVDRFLSITNCFAFLYREEEPTKSWRIRSMIGSVWIISAILSFIPVFTNLFTTEEHVKTIDNLRYENGVCEFKVNFPYRIVSSLISFWLPGIGMVVFYCLVMRKAYDFAKKDANLRRLSRNDAGMPFLPTQQNNNNNQQKDFDTIETEFRARRSIRRGTTTINLVREKWNREFRALKTFGKIMGVFCLCWFFFFLNYTLCNDVFFSCSNTFGYANQIILVDVLFWIGYFNSMVNPILYNFTNKDFRKAFRSLLGSRSNDDTNFFTKIFCYRKKKTSFSNNNYKLKRSFSAISAPNSN
jgi:hypothetical protein